jgi:hypothetical protein
MRDPHVVALHYRIAVDPKLTLNDPHPIEYETATFSLRLADGHLRGEIKDDPATRADASGELEQYLHSWEIHSNLLHGRGTMQVDFEKMEATSGVVPSELRSVFEKRGKPPIGIPILRVRSRLTHAQYPNPPDKFFASRDVVDMWNRYEGFLAGKEPLPGMAQYCLTVVEQSVGGPQARKRAASRYAIHPDVLSQLGCLTSEVGDARTGRKRVPGQTLRPHTSAEAAWMDATVTRIIRRVGEWAADPTATWPQITMEDFPRL